MEDWQKRVVRHTLALTIKGMNLLAAASVAVAEEAKDEEDAEQKRRVMEAWLREHAVATADGGWAIPQSVVEQLKED